MGRAVASIQLDLGRAGGTGRGAGIDQEGRVDLVDAAGQGAPRQGRAAHTEELGGGVLSDDDEGA
jgi:hypothetical protein